ncbi:MAG: hypothetical protein LRY69_00855, partial [Gammaproteobacteria bacterium]|nr:hypothetical protein [Gammaproteobacteria bacterium]
MPSLLPSFIATFFSTSDQKSKTPTLSPSPKFIVIPHLPTESPATENAPLSKHDTIVLNCLLGFMGFLVAGFMLYFFAERSGFSFSQYFCKKERFRIAPDNTLDPEKLVDDTLKEKTCINESSRILITTIATRICDRIRQESDDGHWDRETTILLLREIYEGFLSQDIEAGLPVINSPLRPEKITEISNTLSLLYISHFDIHMHIQGYSGLNDEDIKNQIATYISERQKNVTTTIRSIIDFYGLSTTPPSNKTQKLSTILEENEEPSSK